MKVICNTIALRNENIFEFIPILSQLGIIDLELHISHLLNKNIDYVKFNYFLKKYKINIHIISGGWTDFLTDNISISLKNLNRQIKITKKLKCNKIRIFLGKLEKKYYSNSIEKNAINNLKHISKKHPDITLLFETHDGISLDYKIMNNIFSEVDRDNILINFDPANIAINNFDSYTALKQLYEYIGHIHIKGISGKNSSETRFCEYGEGIFSYDKIFTYLKRKNYNKLLSIEYEGEKNALIALYNSYNRLKKDVEKL